MPLVRSFGVIQRRIFDSAKSALAQPSRALSITSRGKPINREELFSYTNGRFLANEVKACNRRYVQFDINSLCTVAAAAGGSSPIKAIDKMEGGFSKALIMQKEDGSEVVAKIPFSIAGPPKYTTASEVAVLKFITAHTRVPVPKVLAWSSDASNPVGVEYIVMEKAPGQQLFTTWSTMTVEEQFNLVEQLTQFEAELASIPFPANGSLYLRESMTDGEPWVALDRTVDPSGQFCIGPSCERAWSAQGNMMVPPSQINNGPWPNLSSFGLALVEREKLHIEQQSRDSNFGPPRGSVEEQLAVLDMAKEVLSRIDTVTLINRVSRPVLWHTDLHMGNIYSKPEDPAKICSLIDWQSIVVSPLYLQARFPEFLSVSDDYVLGLTEEPKLPQDYEDLDADDKKLAELKFEDTKMSKFYELSTANQHLRTHHAFLMPQFTQELFIQCGEVFEEGAIPLRASLIEFANAWSELGFLGDCPFSYSEEDIQNHDQQFQDYRDFHRVQTIARKLLCTDSEGWISPQLDFVKQQRMNAELLQEIILRSNEYNKTPEEIRRIWPFSEKF
ncbi:kinase-like domain-containing protein [Ampelomyces quisqualis]|uniref:Altered inheritance of mitochondria protein 9, mitochondrial n=1 Tax=Ampelomyces quisqualis TaxID=50730 RepID=A0A6A5Q9H1_AMPQU|nr:kinase-like domain-containing protein [Ampelomyces quisqualis]